MPSSTYERKAAVASVRPPGTTPNTACGPSIASRVVVFIVARPNEKARPVEFLSITSDHAPDHISAA